MSKLHPLSFAPIQIWIRLLRSNRRLDIKQFPQFGIITCAALLLTPVRWIEWILFHQKIKRSKVHPSPIFILGHWRSGTTFLQTLFSQDSQLGYLCGYQAFMPGLELLNLSMVTKFLNLVVPRKRDMDNMPRGLTIPEEEEFALTATSLMGSYHSLWFPKNESYFEKFNLFKDVSGEEMEEWKRRYTHLLKKIVLFTGKERLVLKNPPNTARIKVLLELFPLAKFVNIYRNPYDIYLSMRNMYEKSITPLFLQEMSDTEIDEKILNWYEQVMTKFIDEVKLIPQTNFINIRYEDLEKDPINHMKVIYETFGLDFGPVQGPLITYLESVKSYEKNQFSIDPVVIKKINERWGFAFEYFDYDLKTDRLTSKN